MKSIFLILLVCLLQLASGTAWAHASLIESQPVDASVLSDAPAEFTLHFNEPVAPLVFKLALPDGSVTDLSRIAVVPDGLNIPLPVTKAPGTYLLSWRVISADGHPVGGALTYSVGAPSSPAATVASASPPLLSAVIWLSRFGLYLCLFLSIGGVAFHSFFSGDDDVPPTWIKTLILSSWLLLPVAVGAQGLDALSASWDRLASWALWQTGLRTTYGFTIGLMLAASLATSAGSMRKSIRRRASIVALCLFGFALAASGHAASAPPAWLARPAVFLHAVAIALWAGSLLPLLRWLRWLRTRQGPQELQVLSRFSRAIPWVLVVLLLSGVVLSTLQLPRVSALWLSDYGKILSVKLGLLSLLFAVAAVNRYRFTAGVMQGDVRAIIWMKRLIVLELALVLLIFAAATTWRFTPPPRALALAHPAATMHTHIHTAEAMADLTLIPRDGQQMEAQVFLASGEGAPLTAKEVMLKISDPQRGLEPLEEQMQPGDNQTWQTKAFALPATGRRHVRIEVLISDFESISLEGDIE